MARVEGRAVWTAGIIFSLALLALLVFKSPAVSAGVARAPKNGVETDRSAQCSAQSYSIYGAVWINDVPQGDTTDARWNESATVANNATVIDANMWSTAYNCTNPRPNGAWQPGITHTNSKIINLTPAPGGQVPVTFPYGTEIFRGDSNPGEFTDPPGSLKVQLHITGKASGCYSVAYSGIYKDDAGQGALSIYFTQVCINRLPPSATFSCNAITSSPANPEVGQRFTINYGFTVANGDPAAVYDYSVRLQNISGPGVITLLAPPANPIASGSRTGPGAVNAAVDVSASALGRYSGRFNIAIAGHPDLNCDFDNNPGSPGDEIPVVAKPYFQARQGDVATGINGLCPAGSGWNAGAGTLTAWNQALNLPPANDPNKGAGTNLAALALATITGFASAQNPSDSLPPKGLSFANTGPNPPVDSIFGGGFGGNISCPEDYYANNTKATGGTLPAVTTVQDSDLSYTAPGGLTLSGGIVTGGHRTAIYVDGDVYVANDITLSTGATIDLLSSFYLVAKGNIYIAPGVTLLDGVYIAQAGGGASGGGKIYTCAFAGGSNWRPPNTGELNGACKTKLTVNGAFIANELKLYRSFGSMSKVPAEIAEMFIYTPATWLRAPDSIRDDLSEGYDSITSLPPVL